MGKKTDELVKAKKDAYKHWEAVLYQVMDIQNRYNKAMKDFEALFDGDPDHKEIVASAKAIEELEKALTLLKKEEENAEAKNDIAGSKLRDYMDAKKHKKENMNKAEKVISVLKKKFKRVLS